jgi:hypothetical protein
MPDNLQCDVVRLAESQTQIEMTDDDARAAIQAAYRVTCSPCEWDWTPTEAAGMAQYVLWASQRLAAVAQCATGKLGR